MNYKNSFIMTKLKFNFSDLILIVSQKKSFHKKVNMFNKKTFTLFHVN